MRVSRRRWQAGDTIVEVMIVLAVLGSAISLSYATANRSLRNARQAQDNSYATQLAQAQIEHLRANANIEPGIPGSNYIYNNELFCFDSSGAIKKFAASATPAQRIDNSIYPSECVFANSQDFRVSVDYTSSTGSFEVKVMWDDAVQVSTGPARADIANGKASTTLIYRVYPES